MMDFIIVINFILVIFAFFLIILLFLRQNRYNDLEKKFDQLNGVLEETVASFLVEMKDENDKFLEKLRRLKEEGEQGNPLHEIVKNERPQNKRKPEEMKEDVHRQHTVSEQPSPIHPIENKTEMPVNEHDRLIEKVKKLLQKGYTPEQIAKKLNKGKTEIDLLIKFTPSLLKIDSVPKRE
ncbi:hypothetical protein [Fervidibacillus albus]|uniref:Coupling factor for flagellin transcription and translation n=1 Tax=Fervidibacillus albus TaxID=2980026 RepID=A0A9E8RVJ6_9BACI|nr:hypothetical protein [Fervidibacillus albus]WAA10740.1 hypothetical protein OE104_05330 [Fervidibacillus albus]